MAPVIWGLDLKEIHYNKFKSSYMWNNVSDRNYASHERCLIAGVPSAEDQVHRVPNRHGPVCVLRVGRNGGDRW